MVKELSSVPSVKAKPYVVSRVITVDANTTIKYHLLQVPSATSFIAQRVIIHFPTGSNYTMYVSIYKGEEQVFPNQGIITGDNVLYRFDVSIEFSGGSVIYVKISNTDTVNPHSVVVIVEGVLIE